MAEDIVGGLFGVSPDQLNAQRRAQAEARAMAAAQLDPYARASYLTQLGAGGLMGGVARSLGAGDEERAAYQQRQQMLSQVDMSTPEGILKAAEIARQRGDVQTQLRLQQLANQRQEELVTQQFKQAEIEKMRRAQQEKPDKLIAVVGAGGNPVYVPQSQAAGMEPYYKPSSVVSGKNAKMTTEQETQASITAQQALDQANKILVHPGRIKGTGASSFLSKIPGTEAKGFQSNLDTFKAQTFVPMVQALKGMGALSDAEGRKLTDSVGALDPAMPEKEFELSLKDTMNYLYRKAKAAGLDVVNPIAVNTKSEIPEGVDPAVWNVMTPQEKALWQ